MKPRGYQDHTPDPMRVLLVHGMARTTLSLAGLARSLRHQGHEPISTGYVAALESFSTVWDRAPNGGIVGESY